MGAMGFEHVAAFLASGNVIFQAKGVAGVLERLIARELENSLGYPFPTFVRSAAEVRAIAGMAPFPADLLTQTGGRVQVAFLAARPSPRARVRTMALATERDRLKILGRELFWLPQGNMSDADLDLAAVEDALGPMTIRTKRTIDRIVDNVLNPAAGATDQGSAT